MVFLSKKNCFILSLADFDKNVKESNLLVELNWWIDAFILYEMGFFFYFIYIFYPLIFIQKQESIEYSAI